VLGYNPQILDLFLVAFFFTNIYQCFLDQKTIDIKFFKQCSNVPPMSPRFRLTASLPICKHANFSFFLHSFLLPFLESEAFFLSSFQDLQALFIPFSPFFFLQPPLFFQFSGISFGFSNSSFFFSSSSSFFFQFIELFQFSFVLALFFNASGSAFLSSDFFG